MSDTSQAAGLAACIMITEKQLRDARRKVVKAAKAVDVAVGKLLDCEFDTVPKSITLEAVARARDLAELLSKVNAIRYTHATYCEQREAIVNRRPSV